ncbi:hypothetical protein VHEMI04037 [[Torrubiella] hemipterigena]|uniref:Cytochrome P450 n=1 Tax=[Torrubiella] hemipterigena TaxID=1531966 RepID=A0A0A1TD11_9HYPO|nr:hypothetical protein VHEMI04037 [[Torrubiella] hemipterigena]
MEVITYAIYGPALAAVYGIGWIIYTRTIHPLAAIPGPFWASVTRLWYVYHVAKGDMEHVQRALHARFGPIVRIAPQEVACADPTAYRTIYAIASPWTKSFFYPIWGNKTFSKYPDNFSNTDEAIHAKRRRIVNNVYSMSTVLTLETYIDRCSSLFINAMETFASSDESFDLGEWLQFYTFDVIGELFFGKTFGFMEKAEDHEGYIRSLDRLLPVMAAAAVATPVTRFCILGSSMFSSDVRKALKALDHIAEAARACVQTRLDAGGKQDTADGPRRDLMAHHLSIVHDKGEAVDFGICEVQYEAYVAIFAGSDTTAIALRSIFYHLMKYPAACEKLQMEIDTAFASGTLSNPPKYSEAVNLPYLSATIKEAMRLHPSVGLTMPRLVPKGGVELAGKFIPQGYIVGMNAAVVGHNHGVYGERPDEFDPGRWLRGDTAPMERYNLVFGAGTRTCIGKNISLSEIYKLVPLVMRFFTFTLSEPEKQWSTHNAWFNKQTGVNVRVEKRKID